MVETQDPWTRRALDNVDANPGRIKCGPYVAQLVSAYRPDRNDDLVVQNDWKAYGEAGRREHHWKVERAED